MKRKNFYSGSKFIEIPPVWSHIISGIFVLSVGLVSATNLFPSQSRILFGLAFFMLSTLLIGGGGFLFWKTWFHPKRRDFIKQYYALEKTARYPFAKFFILPEWFFPFYIRLQSLIVFLVGLFCLLMVIDHFLLGLPTLSIRIRFP